MDDDLSVCSSCGYDFDWLEVEYVCEEHCEMCCTCDDGELDDDA